jgi:hypothetical protein
MARGLEMNVLTVTGYVTCHGGQKGRHTMNDSILNGKSILAVNEKNPTVLTVLREEILQSCPNCTLDTATTFKEATERLASFTYHAIILDMGDHGFDLLGRALVKKIPVTTLNVDPFKLEALKRSFETKVMSSLPKVELGEVVPVLEDLLVRKHLPRWKRLMRGSKTRFGMRFQTDWEKKTGLPWREWGKW